MRGRGRGDWEGGRGRGRPPFFDDRDLFRRRSRSREPWRGRDRMMDRDRDRDLDRDRALDRDRIMDRDRERDIPRARDRDREQDRDLDRRDRFDRREDWEHRRLDREDRDRPVDFWKRDRPPSRADSRAASGSTTSSHPPTASGPGPGPAIVDRLPDHSHPDQGRNPSIVSNAVPPETTHDTARNDSGAARTSAVRKEGVQPDIVRPDVARPGAVKSDVSRVSAAPRPSTVRPDASRLDVVKNSGPIHRNSPPPPAPQVPAFGSVAAVTPNTLPNKDAVEETAVSTSTLPAEREHGETMQRTLNTQPPTGPKAERAENTVPLEPRNRLEATREASKHPAMPSRPQKPSTTLPNPTPPTAPAAMTRLDPSLGPHETFGAGRSNSLTSSPTFVRVPPAPRALSREPSMSPRMQPSGIPTGPRAFQRPASSPRGRKGSKQWVRPGYGRTPPVANVPPKQEPLDDRDDISPVDETKRPDHRPPSPPEIDEPESGEILPHEPAKEPSPVPSSLNLPVRRVSSTADIQKNDVVEPPSAKSDADKSALIPDFEGSSDEEDGENIIFTKEYLEERERIFEKDMELLRSELPPSPLEDPEIVGLLLKIQLLGIVANGRRTQQTPDPPIEKLAEQPVRPESTMEIDAPADHPRTGRAASLTPTLAETEPEPITDTVIPPVVSSGEITVNHLPFLQEGPPTPISDMDVYHENVAIQSRLRDTLSTELSKIQGEVFKKNSLLRDEYVSHYKLWRMAIWELDRLKDKKLETPGPASPPGSTGPNTPVPMPEGREGRRYKGNSELDFLNALKASEISAQEELERRRIKMATARPDLGREAVIPNMLEPREVKASVYKDVNNTIACSRAFDVFGFAPPPNDFTPEEHIVFTDAFMAHPKRWGKIAESLPGRNFQQCILHYYLTKEEIKYKAKLNKRWSKRGKGSRKGPRPKSNALIADLGVVKPDSVGEDEPPAVTDTGRPRRAAAPTFGDSTETEGVTVGRRGQFGKDGEPVERSTTRRGGRGGGTRGGRRAKNTQAESKAQVAVPQANLSQAVPSGPPHPGNEMDTISDHVLEGYEAQDRERTEKEQLAPVSRGRAGRGRAKEGVCVFESTEVESPLTTKPPETMYGSVQPTSYWSVPEQRDFPALLGHFGRDFEGISGWMKTKTTVMVCVQCSSFTRMHSPVPHSSSSHIFARVAS